MLTQFKTEIGISSCARVLAQHNPHMLDDSGRQSKICTCTDRKGLESHTKPQHSSAEVSP